jgi:large conductance mechanosensitive channel
MRRPAPWKAFLKEASMLRGFRDFISRGNVVDLAAGVIIGAAFAGIIESLVKDVVTPIIGFFGGQPDFSALRAGPVGLGNFVNAILSFLIKASGLYFLIVIPFNKLAAAMVKAAPPNPQEQLLREIRDILLKNEAAAQKSGSGPAGELPGKL